MVVRLVNLVVPRILEILLRFERPLAPRLHRRLSFYFFGDRVRRDGVKPVLSTRILVRTDAVLMPRTYGLVRAVIILHLDGLARVWLSAITKRSLAIIVIMLQVICILDQRASKPVF